ncbi:hypothetical protein [Dapis sp. BLCC M229]|uniref:hypothetical protein n=1 Tax=Dapis sp. BLCC M229 TaxID=3400188 RepID=UPI003CF58E44
MHNIQFSRFGTVSLITVTIVLRQNEENHRKKSVSGKPASFNGGMEAIRWVLTHSHIDISRFFR